MVDWEILKETLFIFGSAILIVIVTISSTIPVILGLHYFGIVGALIGTIPLWIIVIGFIYAILKNQKEVKKEEK